MKPNAVVETTSAESRALDSSARFEIFDFDCDGIVESLFSLFVASFLSAVDSDSELFLDALFSSSLFDEVEEEKNEL